jgi:hypothetical protein
MIGGLKMTRGKTIYFDKSNGNIILSLGEGIGLLPTTIEQDIATFTALSERNRDTFDVLELPFGANRQDFAECMLVGVDLVTKEPIFAVPDPSGEPAVLDKPLSVQINEINNKFKSATQIYNELDLDNADISIVKSAKLAQLREQCSLTIMNGFEYEINNNTYRFSCDNEAQANFQGADSLFKDNLITMIDWTVQQDGVYRRITVDATTFILLKLEVFKCINSNVSRLRDSLQPQVEATTSNEEVDSINW